MADFNQFGSARPRESADPKHCLQFETMLADAVDGTLSVQDQAAFDLHLVGCPACTEMLADAKRGAVWMEMLRRHAPEPPAAMLARILAQTTGAQAIGAEVAAQGGSQDGAQSAAAGLTEAAPVQTLGAFGAVEMGAGAVSRGNVLPFRKRALQRIDLRGVGHTLLQPRLAMTAAMAFFSIALTMNLTGIHLSELRASDLKPSSLKRSIYEANAHVVRYYTNLRVVYELESRVHDLQRASDEDVTPTPAQTNSGAAEKGDGDPASNKKDQDNPPKRRVSPGTSRREPIRDERRVLGVLARLNRSANGDIRDPAAPTGPSSAVAMNVYASAFLLSRSDLPAWERGTV